MNKCKTAGEFFESRLAKEKVLRIIFILATASLFAFAILPGITGDVLYFVGFGILMIPYFIFGVIYIDRYARCVRNRKWLKTIDCTHLVDAIPLNQPVSPKSKVYCSERALICTKYGVAVPFDQIVWAYEFKRGVNGITVERAFILETKTKKKITLYVKPQEFKMILSQYLLKSSPDLILGYGKEQIQRYKSIVESYKNRM